MTIIISGSPATTGNVLIGYQNHFETGTVTASSEADGFEKENAYDWRTGSYWKPASGGTVYLSASFGSAVSADYFAVYAHNLNETGGSINLQYSTDSGSNWSDATSQVLPGTSRVIFETFDTILAGDWRIKVVSDDASSIGVVAFGEALQFEYDLTFGFAPPAQAQVYYPEDSISRDGEFIGRSVIKRPIQANLVFNPIFSRAWVRANWKTFLRHAERKPFFVLPEPDYNDEALYAWIEAVNTPVYSTDRMTIDLPILCKVL